MQTLLQTVSHRSAMDNSEIADKLTELANLLDISGENPFRVRSYRWAVRTIESSTLVFEQMVRNGQRLTNVDGIGKSIADKMVEIVRTGTCAALEEARQAVNPNVIELLRLEGLGPKKVKKLHEELEIETVDELEAAIAHPTARLILEREGYSFDTVRVFEAARDAGVCMEINANPARLDLKDVQARQVRELGGRLVINTDAHFLRELYNMRFGVWTARRGWIGPADVLNTLSLEALLDAKRKR